MAIVRIQGNVGAIRPNPETATRVSHRRKSRLGQGVFLHVRATLRVLRRRVGIYYDPKSLEINGVHGSIDNCEIFLPLLGVNREGEDSR
jgi:hypothetical protein